MKGGEVLTLLIRSGGRDLTLRRLVSPKCLDEGGGVVNGTPAHPLQIFDLVAPPLTPAPNVQDPVLQQLLRNRFSWLVESLLPLFKPLRFHGFDSVLRRFSLGSPTSFPFGFSLCDGSARDNVFKVFCFSGTPMFKE